MTIREKYKNTLTIYYLKTMKIMVHHNPYDQEMREFGSIENGDLIQLEKSLQEVMTERSALLQKIPCAISKISVLFWSLSQAVLRSAEASLRKFPFL